MTKEVETKLHPVWRIDWTEYERGWGSRPDGYSLYIRKVDADNAYNAAMSGRDGPVPDYYINASVPRLVEQSVEDSRKFTKHNSQAVHYAR